MNVKLLSTLALALALTPVASAKTKAGVRLPNSTKLVGQSLVLNGMGVREATIFKVDVYVAGLYIPKKTTDAKAILDPKVPKKLVLVFVRDVSNQELADAIVEGFDRAAGKNKSKYAKKIAQLASYIEPIKDGQRTVFSYTPERGVAVRGISGRLKGIIPGEDFSRIFFSIWLGKNAEHSDLKKGLLGR